MSGGLMGSTTTLHGFDGRLFSERSNVEEEPAAKLLDDLFCKTTTRPCLYWLPLTEEEVCVLYRCVLRSIYVLLFKDLPF